MRFIPLVALPGLILIEPSVHRDDRGAFRESYRLDLFARNGIRETFVQDNQSVSGRGVLRGLHWQVAPKAQAKLVQVVRGAIFDVAVDIRPHSVTFGRWVSQRLTGQNRKMLFIPVGFAHGFLSLEDDTRVFYKVTDYYSPKHERGLRWDDPDLQIRWPKLERPYLVSRRDRKHPLLRALVPQSLGQRPHNVLDLLRG